MCDDAIFTDDALRRGLAEWRRAAQSAMAGGCENGFHDLTERLTLWALGFGIDATPLLEFEEALSAWSWGMGMPLSGRAVVKEEVLEKHDTAWRVLRLIELAAGVVIERKDTND
jgi:hypothetical protein